MCWVYTGHMGDSLFRAQRQHFRSKRILDRFQPTRLIIKIAQVVVHEGDEPDALADLRHADVLAGEDVAEIHLPPFKANPATLRDGEGCVVEGVGELFEPLVDAMECTYTSAGTCMANA